MKITVKKLADLHKPAHNIRRHSDKQITEYIRSVEMFGQIKPLVVDEHGEIIAGNGLFEALTRMGREPLRTKLGGKVPCVIVDHHGDESADVYGTITHNRARGTHLLEPMKAIVKKLMDEGKTVEEIGKQLGMKPEEVFRLSGFTRDEFLELMTKDHPVYSKARVIRSV